MALVPSRHFYSDGRVSLMAPPTHQPVARGRLRFGAILVLVALTSFFVAFQTGSRARSSRAAAMRSVVERGMSVGRGYLLVYIGDSRCGWCNDPRLPLLLKSVHLHFSAIAASTGTGYRMVGVAVDVVPEKGLRHLRQVGPMFLEVASGGGWQSLGVSGIGAGAVEGRERTPQLVLLDRWVSDARSDTTKPATEVSGQRVIRRLFGVKEIEDWVAAGMPIGLAASPDSVAGSTSRTD